MLYQSLEYQRLLYCTVVGSKSCLCGSVKFACICLSRQPLIYHGHKELCKWGGNGNAAVIIWVCRRPCTLVQWYHFSASP
jgi:hypothetical protein